MLNKIELLMIVFNSVRLSHVTIENLIAAHSKFNIQLICNS